MKRRDALKTASAAIAACLLFGVDDKVYRPTAKYDLSHRVRLQEFMDQVKPIVLFEYPDETNRAEWERLLAAQFPGDKVSVEIADADKAEVLFNVMSPRNSEEYVKLTAQFVNNADAFVQM